MVVSGYCPKQAVGWVSVFRFWSVMLAIFQDYHSLSGAKSNTLPVVSAVRRVGVNSALLTLEVELDTFSLAQADACCRHLIFRLTWSATRRLEIIRQRKWFHAVPYFSDFETAVVRFDCLPHL